MGHAETGLESSAVTACENRVLGGSTDVGTRKTHWKVGPR